MITPIISRFRELPIAAAGIVLALVQPAGASTNCETHVAPLRVRIPQMAKPTVTTLKGKTETSTELEWLQAETLRLRALHPQMGVDRSVPLKGRTTELADGTKISALKDEQLFDASPAHLVRETATVDMEERFVKRSVYKAFARMDCLEFADLGSNYYTAPDAYKPLQFGGRNIVIGASDKGTSPVLALTIAGRVRQVAMVLPGLNERSHNVMIVTNGLQVLCIDPRTSDTWKLQNTSSPQKPQYVWSMLTHTKSLCKKSL